MYCILIQNKNYKFTCLNSQDSSDDEAGKTEAESDTTTSPGEGSEKNENEETENTDKATETPASAAPVVQPAAALEGSSATPAPEVPKDRSIVVASSTESLGDGSGSSTDRVCQTTKMNGGQGSLVHLFVLKTFLF